MTNAERLAWLNKWMIGVGTETLELLLAESAGRQEWYTERMKQEIEKRYMIRKRARMRKSKGVAA